MIQQSEAPRSERIVVHVDAEIEELIPAFFERRYANIKEMLGAVERGDDEVIQRLGHSMKGTGSSYGFDTVTVIGEALECAAKEKQWEEVLRLTGELSSYLKRVEVVYE